MGQPSISLQLPPVKLPGGQVIQPATWVMMGVLVLVLVLAALLAITLILRRARRRRQSLQPDRFSVYSHHSHYAP